MTIPSDSSISDGAKIGSNLTIGDNVKIRGIDISIGDNVRIGNNVKIISKNLSIGKDSIIDDDVTIRSNVIIIGKESHVNKKCDIFVYDKFEIGDISFLGSANFRGREISIGNEFYSSTTYVSPLTIGGGGRNDPTAICKIGDRCTMHNNFINIAMPVNIGNDVGLSPDTIIITHGYWQSVLEGHQSKFAPVSIGDNVWIGMRVIITPGTSIGDECIIGAGSVVTKNIPIKSVAVGVPARVIKQSPEYPPEIDESKRNELMISIMKEYSTLLEYKGFDIELDENEYSLIIKLENKKYLAVIIYSYDDELPDEIIKMNSEGNMISRKIILSFADIQIDEESAHLNLKTSKLKGTHCDITDDLRDYLRRKGIRFYGRKFKSIPPAIEIELKM